MQIVDVRLPQQPHPVVPVVARAEAGATSTYTQRTPMERLYDRQARGGSATPGALLTEADTELIHAVTGEKLWGVETIDLAHISPFAAQIMLDRRTGHLPRRSEVTVPYLERRARQLENAGRLNPFTGAELTRAVRYLQSRSSGGIDIAM